MKDLLFEVKDGIATITLNRPDSRNAFSLEMIRLWKESLEEVRDNDEIRVLVLTGNGIAFCAGGDVKSMKKGKGFVDLNEEVDKDFVSTGLKRKNSLWNYIQRIPLLMEEIDKPTIAAINGDAIGAGLDMALQCDLRFASDTARFGEGYVNVGIVPGDGGGYYLPRIIGIDKALDLLWTGRIIDSEEALKIGLVTRVCSHEALMDEVMAFANRLARGPQQAMRFTKRTVYQGLKTDLRTSLDMVSSFMGLVTEHPDYQEGLQAIIEKRKPKFN
ncbi:enoyl-CoA hydratase [Pueribacillus theae]|uniref:Enoyl-CoA hydratase n=1 Tax=Pueribacillus theae TaxID=2171751 RepID=A0A2U1JSN3_9BACI|nr:enoyl-CoA hydratase-related protein [Pueribacillus theae]PWA08122.1 enoyl-CoA hydratase [Pueribacillus theae]